MNGYKFDHKLSKTIEMWKFLEKKCMSIYNSSLEKTSVVRLTGEHNFSAPDSSISSKDRTRAACRRATEEQETAAKIIAPRLIKNIKSSPLISKSFREERDFELSKIRIIRIQRARELEKNVDDRSEMS